MTVTTAVAGSYTVDLRVASEYLAASPADNAIAFSVIATAPPPAPSPDPVPVPQPAPVAVDRGGGCTTTGAGAPVDPSLLLLLGIALTGPAWRRLQERSSAKEDY
jgi:hypothetical protein